MMIAVLAALMLAAQAPAATPPTAADPTPPASTPAASPPDTADDDAASLETLRQVYQTSCADRDFYTFSDVCNQLGLQVHAAEVAADRAARAAARKKKAAAPRTPPTPH